MLRPEPRNWENGKVLFFSHTANWCSPKTNPGVLGLHSLAGRSVRINNSKLGCAAHPGSHQGNGGQSWSRPAGCVLGCVIWGAGDGSWMCPGKLKGMHSMDTQVGLCGRDDSVLLLSWSLYPGSERNQGMHGIRECLWIRGLPILCFRSSLEMGKPGWTE